MQQRRNFKKQIPLDQRLAEQAKRLRKEAEGTAPRAERDELIRLAPASRDGRSNGRVAVVAKRADTAVMPEYRLRGRLRWSFY